MLSLLRTARRVIWRPPSHVPLRLQSRRWTSTESLRIKATQRFNALGVQHLPKEVYEQIFQELLPSPSDKLVELSKKHLSRHNLFNLNSDTDLPKKRPDTDPTTASDTDPTTASDIDPTTASDTDPTTASDIDPTTASDIDPTTASDTDPTTASDTDPTTASDIDPTTASDTDPTIASNTSPAVRPGTDLPIAFEMPKVLGKTMDEHFHRLGVEAAEPWLKLAKEFADTGLFIPDPPTKWAITSGWTKYVKGEINVGGVVEEKVSGGGVVEEKVSVGGVVEEKVSVGEVEGKVSVVEGSSEPVDNPGEEEMLVFDVEVLYKQSPFAVMACAASPNAWYSWVSPWLTGDDDNPRQLIPLGDPAKARVVVGHNVGYDRARLLEEYGIKPTQNNFLDTMSLHVASTGMCNRQRPTWIKHHKNSELRASMINDETATPELTRMIELEEEPEPWVKKSSINSLRDVAKLHLSVAYDKTVRDQFGILTREEAREGLQVLLQYCAADVEITHKVYKKVLPRFLDTCPHPVSFAALRHLSNVRLPINRGWETYIETAEKMYLDRSAGVTERLRVLAGNALEFSDDPAALNEAAPDGDWEKKVYEKDAWRKQLDPAALGLIDELVEAHQKPEEDDQLETSETQPETSETQPETSEVQSEMSGAQPETKKQIKARESDPWLKQLDWSDQEIRYLKLKKNETVPRRVARQKFPGYPKWYKDLFPTSTSKLPNLTVRTRVAPLLLRMSWDERPLVWSDLWGWTIRVDVNEKVRLTGEGEEILATKKYDEWPMVRVKMDGEKNYALRDDILGAYYKLPHKDGPLMRCTAPLAKSYLQYFENGMLKSEYPLAKEALEMNASCSYWISSRERIKSQMVVYDSDLKDRLLGDKTAPNVDENAKSVSDDGKNLAVELDTHSTKDGEKEPSAEPESPGRNEKELGMILPQIIPMGTITRRAVESTWLTASNAKKNRVGSELKSLVTAPPGYCLVGADVDSEELWIASLVGDSQFGLHGGNAIGFMTLEGTKAAGTDMHSRTASILGISRNQAKIFNYGRIYGAGLKFATTLLRQFNPKITEAKAIETATTLYAKTKGQQTERKNIVTTRFWRAGTESYVFNSLEQFADNDQPRTPVLGAGITEALLKINLPRGGFLTSRINWAIQSSGVDYLHLLIVSMSYLIRRYSLDATLALTVHDEIRYLVAEEDKYRAVTALQVANCWTRAMFSQQLGINDVPQSCAWFSAVDIDSVLRKEVDLDCVTPSHPMPIPSGESVDITKLVDMPLEQAGLLEPNGGVEGKALEEKVEGIDYTTREPVMNVMRGSTKSPERIAYLKAQMAVTVKELKEIEAELKHSTAAATTTTTITTPIKKTTPAPKDVYEQEKIRIKNELKRVLPSPEETPQPPVKAKPPRPPPKVITEPAPQKPTPRMMTPKEVPEDVRSTWNVEKHRIRNEKKRVLAVDKLPKVEKKVSTGLKSKPRTTRDIVPPPNRKREEWRDPDWDFQLNAAVEDWERQEQLTRARATATAKTTARQRFLRI